jgi:MOSC domain-containing protein YiiM
MEIVQITISRAHNFFGHFGRPAGTEPVLPCMEVECVAGRGLRGDRFFDYRPDYAGQITFFAEEVFGDLCRSLGIFHRPAAVLRRNVLVRGVALESLFQKRFSVQGIEFEGAGECKPCFWMNEAFGPGAEAFLQGRGGLRARILTSGVLRCGAEPVIPPVANPAEHSSW